jgi:hypothetical protein
MTPAQVGALAGMGGALVLIGAAIVVLLVERGRQKRRARTAARRAYDAFTSQPLPTPKVPKPPVVYPTEILPPVSGRQVGQPAAPARDAATQIIPRVSDEPDATAVFAAVRDTVHHNNGGTR